MSDRENEVINVLLRKNNEGKLKSRESNTLEFKRSFNFGSAASYAKTMASFANNSGGYILFGIEDSPRYIRGLSNDTFDNLKQDRLTEFLNSYFAPAIDWEMGIVQLKVEEYDENDNLVLKIKKIGWIYTNESEQKPIIALKDNTNEGITAGDVFYRYRARNGKIKPAEMEKIISERITKERENLLKVLEVIRKSGTANLGIVNYSNGRLSTPYGVDIAFDRKLVTQVLRKAKFIKEGSFNETNGIPVLKVTGNIDLAEEVPVPEGNPDDTHPYIQKQMAELLGIGTQDLYALIWYYKMKESKIYHLEITTSKKSKTHKFSEHALRFLKEKLQELTNNPDEFYKIRLDYKNRNK